MKKLISAILSFILLAAALTGCSTQKSSDNGVNVVSTIFPGYDFARQVCGDMADITMLLPPGSESHSYEPSARDIITIQNCDLFICVGGESDAWVDAILESIDTNVKTIRMIDCVGVYEEEIVEGMESEEEHDSEHGETAEYDEHVWTSPVNAVAITNAIREAMTDIDSVNTDAYTANADAYIAELQRVDGEFREFFAGVNDKTLIFGDRFPMRYFTEEYGLSYYAAFPGCSSETEPSAATIAFLTEKVKSEGVSAIYYIEFSNHMVADSIAEAAGCSTAMLNTCHNVSQQQLNDGVTYVSLMEENLQTLRATMK